MKLIHLARQKNKDMTKDAIIKLHCPSYYGLLNLPECATEKQFRRCRECWERNMFPNKKYRTIYADPPWHEKGGGKIKRGADRHYPLMRTEDIMALPIEQIADESGCHLYLWATNNFLPDALKVMEAWGFRYVTTITWFKDGNIGLGQYFRGRTEHCLFGVKGKLPYKILNGKRQQGVTGFISPKGRHSEKPEEMRKMIEIVSYGPYIELFARKKTDGWDAWGNEICETIQNQKS